MASKKVHQDQAEHNEKLAKQLVKSIYYDWACTTAFYSALHYVEAKFFDIPEIVHTDVLYEKTRSVREKVDTTVGVHLFREALLGKKFPTLRISYRQLREVSDQVRYLKSVDKPAYDFLPKETSKTLVQKDLPNVKKGLGFR